MKNEQYEDAPVKQIIRNQIAQATLDFHRKTRSPIAAITLPGLNCYTEHTLNRVLGKHNCQFEGYERDGTVLKKSRKAAPSNLSIIHSSFPFDDPFDGINLVYADLCGIPTYATGNPKSEHDSPADDIAMMLGRIRQGIVAFTLNALPRCKGGRKQILSQLGVPTNSIHSNKSAKQFAWIVTQYIVNKAHAFYDNLSLNVVSVNSYMNGKQKKTTMFTVILQVNFGEISTESPYPFVALDLNPSCKKLIAKKVARYVKKHPSEDNRSVSQRFLLTPSQVSAIRVRHFSHGKFSKIAA